MDVTTSSSFTRIGLAPGTVLRERYEILERIGQGGMGAVYKAADRRLVGRLCAVKEILPGLTVYAEELAAYQEQFYQEASLLAQLDHPNLPKVSDYFSEDGREYLLMDYVPGRDLREIIEEARLRGVFLEESQVLAWARQLCDALAYLHSRNPVILHRDIKPANIKLTPSGHIKLVDFGLAKVLSGDENRTVTVVQGRGTVAYTPLEQYGGDASHTDVRSDIYALGATLYHLLTLRAPVDARQRFLHPGSLPPPRTINPAISPATEQAIMAAMAMHPDDRPCSIEDFADLLFSRYDTVTVGQVFVPHEPTWGEAVAANKLLVGLTLLLLLLAFILSLGGTLS
jgi:serine/threonine-protein kinase